MEDFKYLGGVLFNNKGEQSGRLTGVGTVPTWMCMLYWCFHVEERAECESGAVDLRSCLHLWEQALGGDGTNETVNRSEMGLLHEGWLGSP